MTPLRPIALPALDWALAARASAVLIVGFAALMLLVDWRRGDAWLNAATVAWLNLTLVLAAWAALSRSRDIAILAAVSLVPALVTGIARLHPENAQAYALPIGLYLLAVAAVVRWLRGRWHRAVASTIATVGLLVLLGVGVVQSLDRNHFGYVILTLGEGLALVGLGIAIRWRVLVIGGVAGTVIIALRQLFDAIAALPGWAILGGSGMLLLGGAVVLLLMRARLLAAGRSVAERWSGWD